MSIRNTPDILKISIIWELWTVHGSRLAIKVLKLQLCPFYAGDKDKSGQKGLDYSIY